MAKVGSDQDNAVDPDWRGTDVHERPNASSSNKSNPFHPAIRLMMADKGEHHPHVRALMHEAAKWESGSATAGRTGESGASGRRILGARAPRRENEKRPMTDDQKSICVKMRKLGFSKLTIAKKLRLDVAEVVAYVMRIETRPLPPVPVKSKGKRAMKILAAGVSVSDVIR